MDNNIIMTSREKELFTREAQALFFDLDNTALALGERKVSPELAEGLAQVAHKGIKCVPVTGRVAEDCVETLKGLGVEVGIIAGGAQLVSINPGKEEKQGLTTLRQACFGWFEVADLTAYIDEWREQNKLSQVTITVPSEERKNRIRFQKSDAEDEFSLLPESIFASRLPSPETAGELAAHIEREFSDIAVAIPVQSQDDTPEVHISPTEGTKDRAIQYLTEVIWWDIDLAKAMAVGDGLNDLPMFRVVGHRVAMEDAHPEVKSHADEIIDSQREGGFLKLIASLS